ncbi:MAG: DNA recombination protein RmuC [Alphaproteobacteria bacterium]|nr:DNA recombination protein RmuC [Alphaproteobacteria bacterium]
MDASLVLILAVLVAAAAVAVAVALVLRAERGRAELTGRLAAMAESQAQAQGQLAQRLVEQERALADALATVGRRVGESLEKSNKETDRTLAGLRERLAVIDAAQQNITELSSQVVGLQDILANKQARGAFGEIQLKDLVEAVLPATAYAFQATIGENRRVDCLLRLPNPPGPIAIDAKFPLEGYHALRQAETDAEKVQASRVFSQSILKHVRDIRERYILPGETAEAALMFLPSEAVYAELHANFPNVVEQSFRERVFIVSPTTLWATLNTVRAVFRDVRMREQAHVIQKELHVMLEDVARLDKRVGNLEQHFNLARRDIDEIRISAGKVTRRAERMQELELDEGEAEPANVTDLGETRRRLEGG